MEKFEISPAMKKALMVSIAVNFVFFILTIVLVISGNLKTAPLVFTLTFVVISFVFSTISSVLLMKEASTTNVILGYISAIFVGIFISKIGLFITVGLLAGIRTEKKAKKQMAENDQAVPQVDQELVMQQVDQKPVMQQVGQEPAAQTNPFEN